MAQDKKPLSAEQLMSLLDTEIADLADLPEFKVPDTGVYRFHVTGQAKSINNKPAVVLTHEVLELMEIADDSIPEEERAKAGDKFDVAFILIDNEGKKSEIAEGRMKNYFKPLSEHFGITNNKALLTGPLKDGVTLTAKCTKKARKLKEGESEDDQKYDAMISEITVD